MSALFKKQLQRLSYPSRTWLSIFLALALMTSLLALISLQSNRTKAAGLDSNVVLLLHMDGTDASTSFPDVSDFNHSVTANNGAQVDTAQSQFGGASGLFDSDASLQISHTTAFDFSGDFTIDFWLRPGTGTDAGVLFSDANIGSFLYIDGGGVLTAQGFGLSSAINTSGGLQTNTWQHIALVRSSGTLRIYVNGTSAASGASGSSLNYSGFWIGSPFVGMPNGHMDEFRVSNVARWTSNFTPPSAAYSATVIPSAPTLYNDDGGSTQVAFNNARMNDTSPTFRVSALSDTSFDRFQIELSTTSDFSSQIYTQTFSNTYASATEYNLTANSLSPSLPTTDNTTYYVRVRASADAGSNWSDWSTNNHPTWSYTYKSSGEADWYQTTVDQFDTGTHSGTLSSSGGVILDNGFSTLTYVGGAEGASTDTSYAVSLTGLSGGIGSAPQEGDLVIVATGFSSAENGDPGVSTSGYTEVADLYANDSRDANFSVSWKIMSASPDTSVVCNGPSFFVSVCVVHVWRGVDQSTPMDVAATVTTGTNSSVPDSPSITPVTSGAVVIATGFGTGAGDDTSVTAPAGFGNQVDISGTSIITSIVGISSMAWSGSGAVNPAAWTDWATSGSDSWAAVSLALRPRASDATVGTTTSTAIEYDSVLGASGWDEVTGGGDITDGAITVSVLGADQQPLSGYSCTVTGGTCSIDLSTLDPEGTPNHATIYLQAVLEDDGGTPVLEDWSVSWRTTTLPAVTTNAASNVATTSVTLNGNITDTGNMTGPGTGHGFAWGTESDLSGGDTATTSLGTYSGTGLFSHNLVGLSEVTTYYFRAYAANEQGTSTGSILSFTTTDGTAPTPNPMTFTNEPDGVTNTTITMVATTAMDTNPVEYYFTTVAGTCGANQGTGGTDSGWQSSATYTDTDLQPNRCYAYTVTARDSAGNYTATSSAITAYTEAATPAQPVIISTTANSFTFTNSENSNPSSNPTTQFAVQISNTSPMDPTWHGQYVDENGNPSASAVWLTDSQLDNLTVLNLTENTSYYVRAKARNQDGDETSFGTAANTKTGVGSADRSIRLLPGTVLQPGGGSIILQ